MENESEVKDEQSKKYLLLEHSGKKVVINVYNYFKKTLNISSAVAEASKATGVSERVIYRIKKEAETNNLKPPEKKEENENMQTNK